MNYRMIKEEETTAFGIFKQLYKVRIPSINLLSRDELEEFGRPTTGDPLYDRAVMSELRLVMIPISKMVEYYKEGAQVRVVDHQDCERIYRAIENHLNAWKDKLTKSMNVGSAPIQDLKDLDEFASIVYPHAAPLLTNEFIGSLSSILSKDLLKINSILPVSSSKVEISSKPVRSSGKLRILDGNFNKRVIEQKEPEKKELPKRETLDEFLKQNRSNMIPSVNDIPEKNSIVVKDNLTYQGFKSSARQWRK